MSAATLFPDGPRAFLGVERSLTGRNWRERLDGPACAAAEALVARHDVPDVLARVFAGRGVVPETLDDALEPTLRRLMPDPSTLTGMDDAVRRLADAVERREEVAIFGDYDVDGACAAALLARILRTLDVPVRVHIPDRLTEGYGPNVPAIERFARDGARLLVTVDCGTTSFEPLRRAAELGLDTIVLDHHLADALLPQAIAVVNPNRQDDLSGLGHLCGAGVVFMACAALLRELRRRGAFAVRAEPQLLRHADLVALATVADVVPLKGLNRAFVARGLGLLRAREAPGLRALQDAARLNGPCEAHHLGYLLGPRINAGGRIGDAGLGARLLMTEDPDEAVAIAAELDRLNRERQVVEQAIVAEAVAQAEGVLAKADAAVVVAVGGAHWHPGVLGLVAARLKERFNRPAVALGGEGGLLTGSARSVPGVDLGQAVRRAVAAGLLAKGGGHAMAAGLTVAPDGVEALRAFLDRALGEAVARARADRILRLDGVLAPVGVTPALVALLQKAGPFGSGCPEPVFVLPGVAVAHAEVIGTDHVRAFVEGACGTRLRAMAFRSAAEPLGQALLAARGGRLHLAVQPSLDRWQGEERVTLRVVDAAAA